MRPVSLVCPFCQKMKLLETIEVFGQKCSGYSKLDSYQKNCLFRSCWSTIHKEEFLPKLHSLVLTNNRLVNLVEIDPLASLSELQYLSLLDNNITKKPNYRLYAIHKLKALRVLDFKKIKQKERTEAAKLFASEEAVEEAKKESARTFVPGEVPTEEPIEEEPSKPAGPTPEQIVAIKAAIVNSQTLEEVARLEQ